MNNNFLIVSESNSERIFYIPICQIKHIVQYDYLVNRDEVEKYKDKINQWVRGNPIAGDPTLYMTSPIYSYEEEQRARDENYKHLILDHFGEPPVAQWVKHYKVETLTGDIYDLNYNPIDDSVESINESK